MIGQLLRERRQELSLSHREVDELTGHQVSYAALSRIENGQRYPTLRTLEALSVALGVEIRIARGKVTLKPL